MDMVYFFEFGDLKDFFLLEDFKYKVVILIKFFKGILKKVKDFELDVLGKILLEDVLVDDEKVFVQ